MLYVVREGLKKNFFKLMKQFFTDLQICELRNTALLTNTNLNKVSHDLEKESNTLFKWFTKNLVKANPETLHHLTNSTQQIQISISRMTISNSKCVKLLSIYIDNKLTFESHLRPLCVKASQKLNAFARIGYSFKFEQRKLLFS